MSADFSRLKDEIQAVEAAGADWLHVDVMDGHFVPNITIGPVVVEWVRKVTTIPLDVHLDDHRPRQVRAGIYQSRRRLGVDPSRTCADPNATLKKIRELGAKPSLAVNPDVPLEQCRRLFHDVDMLLMMSVFPGFGGQAFIPDVLPKIAEVRKLIDARKLSVSSKSMAALKPTTSTVWSKPAVKSSYRALESSKRPITPRLYVKCAKPWANQTIPSQLAYSKLLSRF